MVTATRHTMLLRGPRLFHGLGDQPGQPGQPDQDEGAPVLLERSDLGFMAAVQRELSDPESWAALQRSRVRPRGGGLRLYQPVHRVFHLALVSASCDEPGRPRVDPRRIESAGLVIRRMVRDGRGTLREQAWLTDDAGVTRWGPPELAPSGRTAAGASAPTPGAQALDYADPDPAFRPTKTSGRPELDILIARLRAVASTQREAIVPMFPLPPESASATVETLLYGLVPTASMEVESRPTRETPSVATLEEAGFFPVQLTTADSPPVPRPGQILRDPRLALAPDLADYAAFVREVVVTFDLEGTSSGAQRLRQLLQGVALDYGHGRSADALTHLLAAARLFVFGEPDAEVEMPRAWPEVEASTSSAMLTAALAATEARFSSARADTPRFGARGARYVVRAFMRVRSKDGCGLDLVWSPPSTPFEIALWFESSPAPRPIIELPDPLSDGIRAIKPNVAFAVPPSISGLLKDNSPEDLLAGDGREGRGGLAWICSFSIPIITLCAFILLSLLIKLLNIVFWWLPFVKICIPLPRSAGD